MVVNLKTVEVSGNGVTLIWAPYGPGWPRNGTDKPADPGIPLYEIAQATKGYGSRRLMD